MDFWQNFDWMLLIRCFIVGGLICVIGQILIDKTKLTPARILVTYVTVGTILGGLGINNKQNVLIVLFIVLHNYCQLSTSPLTNTFRAVLI